MHILRVIVVLWLAGNDDLGWGADSAGAQAADGLVAAPRKVERITISYAQASKQVREPDNCVTAQPETWCCHVSLIWHPVFSPGQNGLFWTTQLAAGSPASHAWCCEQSSVVMTLQIVQDVIGLGQPKAHMHT